MLVRPSPKNKTVALFASCMVDMIYPTVGISTVRLLDHAGVHTEFPMGQTCCGQPAFNAGFWDDARPVAQQFLRTFADADVIVTPSGSCASMIQHYYPQLFAHDPTWHSLAVRVASITWELTEFLVDGLGMDDFSAKVPPTRVAFHHACHGLRLSGLKSQARQLINKVDGAEIIENTDTINASETCCGFGGLFAVKMADVSSAMLVDKVDAITQAHVDTVLTGDCGCMAQINGGLTRRDQQPQVMHIADFIVSGM